MSNHMVNFFGQGVKNINLTKMFQLLIDFKKNYFNKITVVESAGGLRPIAGTKCAVHNNFSSFTRNPLISLVIQITMLSW